jgi:hypothetical protein
VDLSDCEQDAYSTLIDAVGLEEVIACLLDGLENQHIPEAVRLDVAEALARRPRILQGSLAISRLNAIVSGESSMAPLFANLIKTNEVLRNAVSRLPALSSPPWRVKLRVVPGAMDEFEARYRLPVGSTHGLVEGAHLSLSVRGVDQIDDCKLMVRAVRPYESIVEPECSNRMTGLLWQYYDAGWKWTIEPIASTGTH